MYNIKNPHRNGSVAGLITKACRKKNIIRTLKHLLSLFITMKWYQTCLSGSTLESFNFPRKKIGQRKNDGWMPQMQTCI